MRYYLMGADQGFDPEVLEHLDANRDVVLFCRTASGSPIGYPMRTSAVMAGGLIFTTYRKSAKMRNLERDPRVCVLSSCRVGEALRWVSVEGIARVVSPSEGEILRVFGNPEAVGPASNREPRVPAGMGEFVKERLRDGKRVLIEVASIQPAQILTGMIA